MNKYINTIRICVFIRIVVGLVFLYLALVFRVFPALPPCRGAAGFFLPRLYMDLCNSLHSNSRKVTPCNSLDSNSRKVTLCNSLDSNSRKVTPCNSLDSNSRKVTPCNSLDSQLISFPCNSLDSQLIFSVQLVG